MSLAIENVLQERLPLYLIPLFTEILAEKRWNGPFNQILIIYSITFF
jgi:hypothetical protein